MTLRPLREADLPVLFEHQLDPVATAMAAFPARDRPTHDAHWRKVLDDPENLIRAIESDGKMAGNVVSFWQGGHRQVGYWIGRGFWGTGVATAALRAFLDLEPHRPLRAYVALHNVASIRVLVKCGFERVGMEMGASPGLPPVEEMILELRS